MPGGLIQPTHGSKTVSALQYPIVEALPGDLKNSAFAHKRPKVGALSERSSKQRRMRREEAIQAPFPAFWRIPREREES